MEEALETVTGVRRYRTDEEKRRMVEDLLVPYPDEHLAHSLKFCKFAEYQRNRIAHAPVWVLVDSVSFTFHIAHAYSRKIFTAARLLLYCFD